VGRDRPVVDDAAAAGLLVAHDPEGLAGAEEGAGEVDRDHGLPLGQGDLVRVAGRGEAAGVVEEEIHATMPLDRPVEQGPHRRLVGDVGRDRVEQAGQPGAPLGHRLQGSGPAAGQHHRPAVGGQGDGGGGADAAAGPGDDRDLRRVVGHRSSSAVWRPSAAGPRS
jgi:hypothetical protein